MLGFIGKARLPPPLLTSLAKVQEGVVVYVHVHARFAGRPGGGSLWPPRPLSPATTYALTVPAGGVTDLNGNPTTSTFRATFTTVACAE